MQSNIHVNINTESYKFEQLGVCSKQKIIFLLLFMHTQMKA